MSLHLESFREFISKLKGNWKIIDKIIKKEFDNVSDRYQKKSESYLWLIPITHKEVKYLVHIQYKLSNNNIYIRTMKSNEYQSQDPQEILDYRIGYIQNYTESSLELKYNEFIDFDLTIIQSTIERLYNSEISRNQRHDDKVKFLNKIKEDLEETLPKEDLEEILSEIKDLSIVKFKIKIQCTSTYCFYDVYFKIDQDSDLLDEYTEFYRMVSNAIKRIKNTYGVSVQWKQKMSRMIIHLPTESVNVDPEEETEETNYVPLWV